MEHYVADLVQSEKVDDSYSIFDASIVQSFCVNDSYHIDTNTNTIRTTHSSMH